MGPTHSLVVVLGLDWHCSDPLPCHATTACSSSTNDIDKAWANIDVLLKQRHDESPKLIDTCKGIHAV